MATTWTQSSGDVAATWSSSSGDISATWSQSSGDVAADWVTNPTYPSLGYLTWGKVENNWESDLGDAYTFLTVTSGEWQDLG
jgi:hypothetical protein|tara:strand:+ start:260 stop:505 length:246 start_codon:yes stop_codon:yes gene_type:complete